MFRASICMSVCTSVVIFPISPSLVNPVHGPRERSTFRWSWSIWPSRSVRSLVRPFGFGADTVDGGVFCTPTFSKIILAIHSGVVHLGMGWMGRNDTSVCFGVSAFCCNTYVYQIRRFATGTGWILHCHVDCEANLRRGEMRCYENWKPVWKHKIVGK